MNGKRNSWRRRVLSLLLSAALLPAMGLASAAAAGENQAVVTELAAPDVVDHRFNGHQVTRRDQFDIAGMAEDWSLKLSNTRAAVITAGRTAGTGLNYQNNEMGDAWYLRVKISFPGNGTAGLALGDSGALRLELAYHEGTAVPTLKQWDTALAVLPELNLGAERTIRVLLDNSRPEGLRLYFYDGAENFLGGYAVTGLKDETASLLTGVHQIGFFSELAGVIFEELCVNDLIYQYEATPDAALAKVERWAKAQIEGSRHTVTDQGEYTGITIYTPDGLATYNALWTRDYTYMIEYAPEYVPVDNMIACNEYLLAHARAEDGWIPDRVYADGTVGYSAGDLNTPAGKANLDNCAFIVIAVDRAMGKLREEGREEEAEAFFKKWEAAMARGLAAVPRDGEGSGLIYNDPTQPHSPYGFTDCICKTGLLMKESLLLWRAYGIMEKWQTAYGLNADTASVNRQLIEENLVDTFWDEENGMLHAATQDCDQIDVWGSCYAVSIGFPLTAAQKEAIADYLAENYEGLVQCGQIRHTAPGTYWDRLLSGVDRDTYQNGGYWGTPTGWFIQAIQEKYPALAAVTLQDVISYYDQTDDMSMIRECINGSYYKLPQYVTSATNIVPVARDMLTMSPDLTEVTVEGDQEAKVGAAKRYTAVLTPANVKVVSYAWTVNGQAAGSQAVLDYRFEEAGTYEIAVTVTDLNGNQKEAGTAVHVTERGYTQPTVTISPIYGSQGSQVTATYVITEDSCLTNADLTISYDSSRLEPVLTEDSLSPVATAGAGWDGVLASAKGEEGTIKVTLAAAQPFMAAGSLFSVSFRLRQTVSPANSLYAEPAFQMAMAHFDDGIDGMMLAVELARKEAKDTGSTSGGVVRHTLTIHYLEQDSGKPVAPAYQIRLVKGSAYHVGDRLDLKLPGYRYISHTGNATGVINGDMTINVYFAAGEEKQYSDVAPTAWYYDAVRAVTEQGIMSGVGEDRFAPMDTLDRAMMVQILYNLEDRPESAAAAFSDVSAQEWFAPAVGWAVAEELAKGYDDGTFGPRDRCTREQVVAFLYRYAQKKGLVQGGETSVKTFVDAEEISPWAREAMNWAVNNGLIQGKESGRVDPQGQATRAEVASVMQRLIQQMVR